MTTQLAVRLSEETLDGVDRLVRSGKYANRTEAIRAAVAALLRESERREIEIAMLAGYERVPDAPEDPWLDSATRALVSAEPW